MALIVQLRMMNHLFGSDSLLTQIIAFIVIDPKFNKINPAIQSSDTSCKSLYPGYFHMYNYD